MAEAGTCSSVALERRSSGVTAPACACAGGHSPSAHSPAYCPAQPNAHILPVVYCMAYPLACRACETLQANTQLACMYPSSARLRLRGIMGLF